MNDNNVFKDFAFYAVIVYAVIMSLMSIGLAGRADRLNTVVAAQSKVIQDYSNRVANLVHEKEFCVDTIQQYQQNDLILYKDIDILEKYARLYFIRTNTKEQ